MKTNLLLVAMVAVSFSTFTASAAEPLRLPAPPAGGEQWVPGIEYIAIVPSRKTAAPAGKVEVVFRHQYTVSIFRPFEAALAQWVKSKPDYIHVVRKPHVHYPHARFQARMFLTLQQMSQEELALTKLYDWIWDKQRYPLYHNLYQPDAKAIDRLNLEFARGNRLDEKEFLRLYASPEMDKRVIDEEADSLWELDTMTMIDGTFATDLGRTAYQDLSKVTAPENFARFFRLIEYLAAARHSPHPSPQTNTLPPGTLDGWTTAFNSGDQAGLLATYTEDTVLMPPNAGQVRGHEGVLQIFGEGLKGGLKATQTTETFQVREDMAFRSGAFTLADSTGAEIDRGKFIELWRKDSKGNWKMSHDMWSSDKPALKTSSYLDYSGRDDLFAGGIRMIPVQTPKGVFKVWTKRIGNNPKIKVLLLHGGPGSSHEYLEVFDSYFPSAGIEYYYYDQLGSYYSDQPRDPSLWDIPRFVEEVEQVRQVLKLDKDNFYLYGQSWGGALAVEYALNYPQHLKALIISNMMMSGKAYNEYAEKVKMPSLDPAVLAEIKRMEASEQTSDPRYLQLVTDHYYVKSFLRLPPDQWPETVNRTFKHLNLDVYLPMQGPSELGVSGKLLEWDRSADIPKIAVPTLSIGAQHDTMDPKHMEWIANTVQHGRYLHCPDGSHLALYDDQKVYFEGLIQFIQDVDAGRF